MLVYAATFIFFLSHVELRVLVHTEVGSIEGVVADDGDYVMFLGIPYARVNMSNPFGASISQEKFKEVFKATSDSVICPQMREGFYKTKYGFTKNINYDGTLDCLRLHVYVPNSETKHKAVYLYIHGGQFLEGNGGRSYYGPKYLVYHDIIVVTINYRLGPYGFMCLDTPEIPGNQGLWDQYKAMEWVRDNIQAFGGDPEKVTIGGHSSGAMLVDMHLLTKQPRLFQQAILQSGSAINPHFVRPSYPEALTNIANKLGFKTNDTYAALSFLAKESPESVVKASVNVYDWSPCIEKEFDGVLPFIIENPELSERTNVDGLNILGGFTLKECIYTLYDELAFAAILSQPDVFRADLDYKFTFQNDSNVVDIVRQLYLGDDKNDKSNKYKIIDFFTDFDFIYPVQRELIKYAKHRNTNVYLYMFSYDGHMNRFKKLHNVQESGAVHSDELGYIFTMEAIADIPKSNDKRKIDEITMLWTNFIKFGNPTPCTTDLISLTWPPLTADTVPCLQIDDNLSVISRPLHKEMAFWDLFYEAHLDKLR